MGKKVALIIVALLGFGAAAFMHHGGETNPAWTEMKGVWWIPLPLAIMSLMLALRSSPKQ